MFEQSWMPWYNKEEALSRINILQRLMLQELEKMSVGHPLVDFRTSIPDYILKAFEE